MSQKLIYGLLMVVTLATLGVFFYKSQQPVAYVDMSTVQTVDITPTVVEEVIPIDTVSPTTITRPTTAVFPTSPPVIRSSREKEDDGNEREDDD